MRRRHAEAVAEVWALWRRMPAECEVWEQEWGDAFEFAVQHDWALAKRLGYPAGSRLRCQRREPEAAEVYARMHHEARERWRDAAAAEECCRELEWLRDDLASARQWAEAGPEQMALPFGAAGSG
jgi:hypothetical protein